MTDTTPVTAPAANASALDPRELAGALADVGVLVPIAVALILVNGLSATAVLLPSGLLYLAGGLYYRLPVPVQPLKAFGAIAVAHGLGADVVAAGALLMGLLFVPLGASGLMDRLARWVPTPVVRGIQLSVGLLFLSLAWRLLTDPPASSPERSSDPAVLLALAAAVTLAAWAERRRGVVALLVAVALGVAVWRFPGPWLAGPAPVAVGIPSPDAFAAAAMLLVLPQLPLTFANSCVATESAARAYFGDRATRVTAGRLATSLGLANLVVGLIGGMPLCHGSGGLTAHRSFGARTGAGVAVLGMVLVLAALLGGRSAAPLLAGFPLPVLAGLLVVSGLLHIRLLADLRGAPAWCVALGVGVGGFVGNLAAALVAGAVAWWLCERLVGVRGPQRRGNQAVNVAP